MGEVYLALDTKLNRTVALKVLRAGVSENPDHVRGFVQEAKAVAALNHPNIAHIYEISKAHGGPFATETIHFITMEYTNGQTLRQQMNQAKMEPDEVVDIAIQVARALSVAHAAHIVHRDIKPENILRREDGTVKVVDFGIAKIREGLPSLFEPEAQYRPLTPTQPGEVLGTVTYMSPEQARAKDVGMSTDIFSLGVVIYEMLAGTPPFSGETVEDRLRALLNEEPRSLAELAPEVPPELQVIVSKALRKDRAERYQTVNSLLEDLVALRRDPESTAKETRPAYHALERAELLKEIRKLPIAEREAVVEEITRSIRQEIQPTSTRVSIVDRLYGIAKPDGPIPSDEELKEDYIRHLTEKYS